MTYAENITRTLYELGNRGYQTDARRIQCVGETFYETTSRLRRVRRWNRKVARIRRYSDIAELGPVSARRLY